MTLRTDALAYDLPPELIAQEPAPRRDESRLLVLHREADKIEHRRFRDLESFLAPGDCLALNTTRVRHARCLGRRASGGKVELLLIRPAGDGQWQALGKPAAKLRPGERVALEGDLDAEILAIEPGGRLRVRLAGSDDLEAALDQSGHVPLPPYIARPDGAADRERYQTVYADTLGAVAAPTAGLHFTPELLDRLAARGVRMARLVLHVGPGTFQPITTDFVHEHRLDREWYAVSARTRRLLADTKAAGGRIVAVGTTSVRTLETLARRPAETGACSGWADLLVSPPFEFKLVDAILTNFHLPRSSLLALVAAFAGLERTLATYRIAVEEQYRFYSYGDAMLIL
jgi:S-adenosylmethionine:tRNA ribosyltransferase-isomerase